MTHSLTTAEKDNQDVGRRGVQRVAIVLSELRAGGMERVVVHLACGLRDRCVTPRVFCLQSKGPLAADLEATGIEVVEIGSHRSYDLKGVFRLAAELKTFRPDVINVHDYSSLPYAAVSGLSVPRSPIVFTAHGLLYEGFDGKEGRYRLFAKRVRSLTAVSTEVSRRHREFLDWHDGISIVPNGVPSIETSAEIRHGVRQELNIQNDEVVFLAVGNPRPEKAFEDLISAAASVARDSPMRPFSVLIAGTLREDEYCTRLQRLAMESAVPGLRLLGFRSDVQRLYSAADVLVVSSRSEGLPMVILEAMTAGLPILSTRVGGIPDALPKNCGRLVQAGNPSELANGLNAFLSMPSQELRKMGDRGRGYARQRFSVDAMISRYLDVFALGNTSNKPVQSA
ncbi:glycosyltransferase [Rhodopirellula sp. JC639]|uniref:glycosyltransferase n=1 Tax=Stieleria mannarensis TaxID=2755585 RepID=UPI0016014AD7|nr:glycosyltransferase [Rhodopirellula sp. JC639]